MESYKQNFAEKIQLLKEARLRLLRLHKDLIDIERQSFEKEKEQLSAGQFLQILLNDENFSWLRKFSMLIVEIDEMFDLDDGYNDEMVEKQFSQLRNLLDLNNQDEDFNSKFANAIKNNSVIETKYIELKNSLTKK